MNDRELTRERLVHALEHAAYLAVRLKMSDPSPERTSLTLGHIRRESIRMRDMARALEV